MTPILLRLSRAWENFLVAISTPKADVHSVSFVVALLALLIAGSTMALGAQHVLVLSAAVVGAAVIAAIALKQTPTRFEGPALAMFGLGAWTFVQALPLPLRVLRALAPKNATIWERAYTLTQSTRTFASLSLDPGASLVEAAKWTSYGAVAAVAAIIVKRLGLRPIAVLAFTLALLVAAITVGHGLLRAHKVFGFYSPSFDPGPWGVSPILNANNRAGYLNLGTVAGIALLTSRDLRRSRWGIALGVGVLVAVSLLAHSRGGILALGAGSIAVVITLVRRALRARDRRRKLYLRTALAPIIALVGGLVLALIGGDPDSWLKMRQESLEKIHVIEWTRPMFSDFAVFGTGRGAFETVFPEYRMSGTHQIYNQAENFVAQWSVEWGLLVAVPALLGVLWITIPRRSDDALRAILRLAFGVLLLQNLVDHALEMPAVGFLCAALVGGLAKERRPSATPSPIPGFSRHLVPAALGVIVAGVLLLGRHNAYNDRRQLSEEARLLPGNDDQLHVDALSDIRAAVLRHPADPFLPLLGALVGRTLPQTHPLKWLSAALERDGMSGHNHLALAYFLIDVGARLQALDELRIAADRDPGLAPHVAKWASVIAQDPDELRRAIPDGQTGARVLLLVARTDRFAPYKLGLLEDAVERDPDLQPAHAEAAIANLNSLDDPTALECAGPRRPVCVASVGRHIGVLEKLQPTDPIATELTARLLASTGRMDEARALLSERCIRFLDAGPCWQLRITLGHGEIAGTPFRDALRSYYAATCVSPETCAASGMWVGLMLEGRRDFLGALEYYGRAIRDSTGSSTLWLSIARAARLSGQPQRANDALKRARSIGASDSDVDREMNAQTPGLAASEMRTR